MTEEEYIALFETMAANHREIAHTPERKSFFYIEEPDELGEFDQALKSMGKNVAMLLVANNGEFNDNGSNSYHEELNGQMYIVVRKTSGKSIREINSFARKVLLDVLGRVRKEYPTKFRLNNLQFQKVGPMNDVWYGYTVQISFDCPFGFVVNSGNWLDK